MKKRLHNKKAGIAVLISLIIISLADVIFRAVTMGEAVLKTSNMGEQLAVIAFATTILILTAKGKDRACYICYGAWAGYFALDQLFEMPGAFFSFVSLLVQPDMIVATAVALLLRMIGMICIIAIGVILVEYMNDGTIYNRAFNTFSIIALLAFVSYVIIAIIGFINEGATHYFLAVFNVLYYIAMIFLFTFFAYDSAKAQLKKVDFKK
ncbi:MAG: hypothetical protein IKW18_05740 [Clostridia bacterium]|nr:hypothetical protein [Clostridia bacterium]